MEWLIAVVDVVLALAPWDGVAEACWWSGLLAQVEHAGGEAGGRGEDACAAGCQARSPAGLLRWDWSVRRERWLFASCRLLAVLVLVAWIWSV